MGPEKQPTEGFLDEEDEWNVYGHKDDVGDDVAEHETAHRFRVGENNVSEGKVAERRRLRLRLMVWRRRTRRRCAAAAGPRL